MTQVVVRLDDGLVAEVDDLIERGILANRSVAVRDALRQLVDRQRRAEVGARIAAGYRARPQADDEGGWSDEASTRMIADEPW